MWVIRVTEVQEVEATLAAMVTQLSESELSRVADCHYCQFYRYV